MAGVAMGSSAGAACVGGLDDAVLLAPLTEDTFLHNLHARFARDVIYTYVGNTLVSVNPCRALPLYSAELVRAYLSRAPYTLPPHLYAITANAYRWVRDRNESQCIVITGESGSGKTEAARVCLQCLALAGGGGAGAGGGRGDALAAAGTLLEAFGNAATARNHNASRFGKLLEVEFNFKGEPVGGHITHYLLEKVTMPKVSLAQERATSVPEGERNFHVLYQLLAGADAGLLKRLRLQRAWEQYRVLRARAPLDHAAPASPRRAPPGHPAHPAHPAHPPHAQDKEHFNHTKAAMATLGLGGGEWGAALRVLAFLLKLGNVHFEPQHNIDGSIGARLLHHYELAEACALVGVEACALAGALGAAPDAAPEGPFEEESADEEGSLGCESDAEGDEGAEWASAARDRLVSAVYSRLFTWLVRAANDALRPKEEEEEMEAAAGRGGGGGGAGRCVGVLDVYGLERLAHNGLERLLINYAAERVQAAVTGATLRAQQEEYVREGLAWRALPYTDHEALADLLDAGPDSVLGALRESRADGAFLQRLQRLRHPRLLVHPPHHFTVVHFGVAVRYSARGIVERDRDAVCRRAAAALGGAREPLLAALFPGGAGAGAGASPRRGASLAGRQRALLAALARRVAAPRLVRCVRADRALRPARFEAPLVRQQIRTQGILEMAMLRRAGWCESMCARALLARYGVLRGAARGARGQGEESPVRAARALLRSLPIPSAEFAYGRTKVFIRSPRTVWELEALRGARVLRLVTAVQRAWRRHRARTRARAATAIARAWRSWCRRRDQRRAADGSVPDAALALALAAGAVWRWWCDAARRRYVARLWRRLPARHMSPACGAWPTCPQPRLLARADALLRRLHHAWRCRLYRLRFDQTARNRMREKVTASVLFAERKATYARSVAHPFVGDYVRLRASAAWRRALAAAPDDRYVVFADVVGKVARSSGRVARCLAVVSTGALVLLEARSLRLKRRVPARAVHRLSLSPYDDDLLVVHVRACEESAWEGGGGGGCGAGGSSGEEGAHAATAPGCLSGGGGGGAGSGGAGDVVLRSCHALELATKLFLVVQNAAGAPPLVTVAAEFEANFGYQVVTMSFHSGGGGGGGCEAGGAGGPRVLRRGSRMDVLL